MSLKISVPSFFFFALFYIVVFSSAAQCADEVRLDPKTLFVVEASERWYKCDNKGDAIINQCEGNFDFLCKDSKENSVLRFRTSYRCTIRGLLETAKGEGKDFCYPGSLECIDSKNTLSLIKLRPAPSTLKIGTKFGTISLKIKKETVSAGFLRQKTETRYILTYTQVSENSTTENSHVLAILSQDSAPYILEIVRQIKENDAEYTINLTELKKLKTLVKDKIIELDDEVFDRLFKRVKYVS